MTTDLILEMIHDAGDSGEIINVLPPEFNAAICGLTEDAAVGVRRVVYDKVGVIAVIQMQSEPPLTAEEAQQYFDYNVATAYVAPAPPLFMIGVMDV